jgi:hypothetical protein
MKHTIASDNNEQGFVLVLALFMLTICTMIGMAAMNAMARQPEIAPKIQVGMLIAAGMIEGVAATAHFGQRLHVFCRRGRYDEASLSRALSGRGVEVELIRRVAVTLEDAFVRMVQQQQQTAGPGADRLAGA